MISELPCECEYYNEHDPYAVAIKKDSVVVGRLPRMHSATFWSFLQSSSITCRVTGTVRYSRDLQQGGLEIPCDLIFQGDPLHVEKVLKRVMKEAEKKAKEKSEVKKRLKERRPVKQMERKA